MKNKLENKKTITLERTLWSDNATLYLCRKKERAKGYRGAHKAKLLHQKMKSLLKRRDAHNTFTNTTQEEEAVVRCIQRENLRQLKKKQKIKN